jgi:2-keto-4-pentenoate hydratase
MANDFSARGFGLEAGQVVTTGAAAAPTPAQPGQTVTVRFGDVGEVIARLV